MSASRDMHITLPQDVADWLYAQAALIDTPADRNRRLADELRRAAA